ncbi:MAG: hypothetical protein NWF00_05305 [Candidatus Bathyarchaeota archaeon]|nr:hypothetical protein [Candidatus Bathyarchaeota archaeon]
MTFSYQIQGREVFGTFLVLYGTYASGEMETGGDVDLTGELHSINVFLTQPLGEASSTTTVLNESFPTDPVVTIVTESGGTGIWFCLGR